MGRLIDNPNDSDGIFTELGVGDWAFFDQDRAIFIRIPVPDGHYSDGIHFLRLSPECRLYRDGNPIWNWDGNREAPTITPSILDPVTGWHGYLRAGVLETV